MNGKTHELLAISTHTHTHTHIYIYIYIYEGVHPIMVDVVGNRHSKTSSNPKGDNLHFTSLKGMNAIIFPSTYE